MTTIKIDIPEIEHFTCFDKFKSLRNMIYKFGYACLEHEFEEPYTIKIYRGRKLIDDITYKVPIKGYLDKYEDITDEELWRREQNAKLMVNFIKQNVFNINKNK